MDEKPVNANLFLFNDIFLTFRSERDLDRLFTRTASQQSINSFCSK